MRNAAFHHLLAHYRSEKSHLHNAVECYQIVEDSHNVMRVARSVGALECLYWQALGNDLVNLAKGIRRTITKAQSHHGIKGLGLR